MTHPTRRLILSLPLILAGALPMHAQTPAAPAWSLPSLDGKTLKSQDYRGKILLLVNSASLCGYTPQYEALQALQDKYGPKGLVVLAVPSDDFHQEKASNAEVKDFCTLTYGLTLPIAEISHVKGPEAVEPYRWLATQGFVPQWNFNKVLFDGQGHVAGTWGAPAEPLGGEIEAAISRLLG